MTASKRHRVFGAREEVAAQQVVGDRRLDFDAGEPRVERRGHDLAAAERGCADEDDRVLEDVAGVAPPESTSTAETYGNAALACRGSGAAGCFGRRAGSRPVVSSSDVVFSFRRGARRPGAGGGENGRERQARIGVAVVVDDERHAPEDAVGVGHRVEEARPAGGLRQRGQAADRAVGAEERQYRRRRPAAGRPERRADGERSPRRPPSAPAKVSA